MSTIVEKTYAIIGAEQTIGCETPMEVLGRTALAIPIADHADWGLTLGAAIAIARSEDPFEDMGHVVERAFPAAAEAFKRFSGVDVLALEAVA